MQNCPEQHNKTAHLLSPRRHSGASVSKWNAEHSSLISNTGFLTSWPPLPSVGFQGFEIICAAFCCRIHGPSVTSMTKLTDRTQRSWVSALLGHFCCTSLGLVWAVGLYKVGKLQCSYNLTWRLSLSSWCEDATVCFHNVKQKCPHRPFYLIISRKLLKRPHPFRNPTSYNAGWDIWMTLDIGRRPHFPCAACKQCLSLDPREINKCCVSSI